MLANKIMIFSVPDFDCAVHGANTGCRNEIFNSLLTIRWPHRETESVTPAELEQYLHTRIPLSKSMGVSAVTVRPDSVVLRAPLAPNINPHETVFGGSASAIAILAAWSLLHTRLHSEGIANRLVIRRNTMEYEHPTVGEFTATSSLESPALDQWSQFIYSLAHKGKARMAVLSVLEHAGHVTGRLRAEIVALGPTERLPPAIPGGG